MKLSDFVSLTASEKKNTVLHQGILVAKRKLPGCLVFLFQLDGFYVETFCNTESNEIDEYRMFDNTKYLHPYLAQISIDSLLLS